eukprot:6189314-Pleurochrysis_carterae.AAC.2
MLDGWRSLPEAQTATLTTSVSSPCRTAAKCSANICRGSLADAQSSDIDRDLMHRVRTTERPAQV